jgi:ribosome-associated toxin RatA of RatAB toxin-antitoxin module
VRKIDRQALVPFTANQMYAVVEDVESYCRFLPWCKSSRVVSRTPTETVASLDVSTGPLHTKFTTRNRLDPPGRIALELVEGPFRELKGEWSFEPIADKGAKVRLQLQFAFANPLNALVLEPVFEHVSRSLVDAFVRRAREIYDGRQDAQM